MVLKNLRERSVNTNATKKKKRNNEDFIWFGPGSLEKTKAANSRFWCCRVIDSRVGLH
jgi:hypothetical protein